jgi:hypothetical protein
MRRILPIVGLILVAPFVPFAEAADVDTSNTISSALTVLTGNDSRVSKLSYRRVGSAAEWKKTWLEHLGLKDDTIYRTAMEVGFNRCMVIAIFGGKTFNNCGYQVESVGENKNTIIVRFSNIGYQTAGPGGGADRVSPYAFIVLPKSDKPIVLEETTHSSNPKDAPVSREVARLGVER